MKKYKLIKKYPGSPELNEIWNEDTLLQGLTFSSTQNEELQVNQKISNFKEFWEEVIEKDYEILSFKQDSKIEDLWEAVDTICDKFARKSGKMFCTTPYTLERILNNPLYSIHSVKRLSDGEVFTIGDKLDSGDRKLTISSIFLDMHMDLRLSPYEVIGTIVLKNAVKYKKPLFTTEDGVDIFAGDNIHWVCDEFTYFYTKNVDKYHCNLINNGKLGNFKIFPSKEAAEEYILMNKPCLSLNDLRGKYSKFMDSKENITNFLKNLVLSKEKDN